MIKDFILAGGGVVVGVIYHAKLQPSVTKGWAWLKDRIGTRTDAE